MSDWKCRCHKRVFRSKKGRENHLRWVSGVFSSKMLKGINKGALNVNWKGDEKLHTISLHEWVNDNIGIEKKCNNCGSDKNIDLANVTGIYERDFANWEYLCRKCHMVSDSRINNLKQFQGGRYI